MRKSKFNESQIVAFILRHEQDEPVLDVHVRETSRTKEGNFNLKWVYIAIRNLKKHLEIYHLISERIMQN
jgi:hypothetical protein